MSAPHAERHNHQICVACASDSHEEIFGGLMRCRKCGHAFAPVESDGHDLAAIYTENYFKGEEYRDYVADKAIAQRNFRARLRVLKRFTDPARHRRLFEVGCAYGFFLELARDMFEDASGIDVAAAAVSYARERGLDAACADLVHYDLGAREIDVACMWDTVEHLARPDLYVAKLAQHMRGGALIAITTGDFASLNARLRRTRWRLMHPPSHAHYFSIASMRTMLDRLGFDTVYARHCGYSRSLGSMAHGIMEHRAGSAPVLAAMRRLGLDSLPLYLNLYDIMYVIARMR